MGATYSYYMGAEAIELPPFPEEMAKQIHQSSVGPIDLSAFEGSLLLRHLTLLHEIHSHGELRMTPFTEERKESGNGFDPVQSRKARRRERRKRLKLQSTVAPWAVKWYLLQRAGSPSEATIAEAKRDLQFHAKYKATGIVPPAPPTKTWATVVGNTYAAISDLP